VLCRHQVLFNHVILLSSLFNCERFKVLNKQHFYLNETENPHPRVSPYGNKKLFTNTITLGSVKDQKVTTSTMSQTGSGSAITDSSRVIPSSYLS